MYWSNAMVFLPETPLLSKGNQRMDLEKLTNCVALHAIALAGGCVPTFLSPGRQRNPRLRLFVPAPKSGISADRLLYLATFVWKMAEFEGMALAAGDYEDDSALLAIPSRLRSLLETHFLHDIARIFGLVQDSTEAENSW